MTGHAVFIGIGRLLDRPQIESVLHRIVVQSTGLDLFGSLLLISAIDQAYGVDERARVRWRSRGLIRLYCFEFFLPDCRLFGPAAQEGTHGLQHIGNKRIIRGGYCLLLLLLTAVFVFEFRSDYEPPRTRYIRNIPGVLEIVSVRVRYLKMVRNFTVLRVTIDRRRVLGDRLIFSSVR